MSKSLVKRLRAAFDVAPTPDVLGELLEEAADRIERLELDNTDQTYQIEKLIYRRDHPGEL